MLARTAFNMLPWYIADGGLHPELAPPLGDRLTAIKAAGYDGVHAEVPPDMTPAAVAALYADFGLLPAPGYFQASFSDPSTIGTVVEGARTVARQHAEMGLDRIFLAEEFGVVPERIASPAQGVGADSSRLARVADGIGRAAEAMVAEGVVPCFHQHIGTLVETVAETEAILSAVPDSILLLGPDTGHLTWAGADPVAAFIRKHRGRIGAVHIKDMRKSVAARTRAENGSYFDAGFSHVWTEPGRGDIDLEAVLAELTDFEGWYVVEVDIADQPTVEESAIVSAAWLKPRLAGRP